MARVRFKTTSQILAHYRPQAQRALTRALLVGERVTKVNTPVLTGTARRSVHVEPGPERPSIVSAQLGSSVGYYKWIEIGSNGRPGKFPLAKGLEAAVPALHKELEKIR